MKHKLKCFLSVLIIFGVLITLCPAFASEPQEMLTTGNFGDNISWMLKDNILILSGTGATYDFESDTFSSSVDYGIITRVNFLVIEEGITAIGKNAFKDFLYLTEVVCPKSLEKIEENAFYGCWDLHYISIPDTTQFIAENAFSGTQPIIFAPEGSYAHRFSQANNLVCHHSSHTEPVVARQGTLSNGITWCYTTDGTLTISGNGALEDFPSSSAAPWYRLGNIGLKNLIISEGITYIGRENFAQFKNLKTITLPSTLKTIGMYAFIGCESLEKIILPDGFAGLGDHSLYFCSSLKELVIPSSMYIIGDWALYGLDSVEKYTVSPLNLAFSSDENGVLYNADKTAIIKYPAASSLKSYTVPASVSKIYPYAFDGCSMLEEVNFEENSALDSVGNNSFSDSAIKRVTLPKSVKFIGEAAFYNCQYLECVSLSDGLLEIKDSAFGLSGITSIKIPSSVTTIGNSAFVGCKVLEKVEFSEMLTSIGHSVFNGCNALKEINLPQSLSWLDPGAFTHANTLEKITVSEQNPYYSVDEYGALYYCKTELVWYPVLSENKSYTIPQGVTKLNNYIFGNAISLEEVVLPSTVSKIPSGAFRGCSGLKSITIPKEVTEIEAEAFISCDNLTQVIFEEGSALTSIGVRAFQGCKNLRGITVPDSVTTIKSEAFDACTYLEKVVFSPDSKLESISDYLFTDSHFVTIYAPEGTVARTYAEKHRIHVPLTVNIDGEPLLSDVLPMIVHFRTMIPMRAVFEALDAEVTWDEQTRTATAVKDETKVDVTVGSYIMIIDDKEYPIDSPAFTFEDRIMIPVRAVSEAFGYDVTWDEDTKTVDITSK